MDDKTNNEKSINATKIKQQITVPFLWEEKPGQPKENWQKTTPKRKSSTRVVNPVKYIASVPFKWEEKPGTPLESFAQVSEDQSNLEMTLLPLPPAYFASYGTDSDGDSSFGDEFEFHDWMSEIDESSFCSASSLLQANNVVSSKVTASSSVVRLQNPFLTLQNDEDVEGSSSSDDSSSPKSCASRNASLKGAAFLQYLFPLYPPKSSFLDKSDNSESKRTELMLPPVEENKKLEGNFRRSGVIRRPLTLEELIVQRRRASYRRKASQLKKKNPPKDIDDFNPHSCFNFGPNAGRLTELFGKDLLTLKLS